MKHAPRSSIAFACALGAALLACGCGGSNDSNTPISTGNPASGNAVTVTIAPGATALGPSAYGVNPLVETKGVVVTWFNADRIDHTATADDSSWDTGPIQPHKSFSYTFSSSGTFHYHCTTHPSETGSIQVQ